MSNKSQGTAAEREERKRLEAQGFTVTRAAASFGAADLIGVRVVETLPDFEGDKEAITCTFRVHIVFVQVKSSRERAHCPPANREALQPFHGMAWAQPVIALYDQFGRKAQRRRELRWDGEEWREAE